MDSDMCRFQYLLIVVHVYHFVFEKGKRSTDVPYK